MVEKIKKMNTALPELIIGIFIYGILCEMIGIFMVSDELIYTMSLGIGILTAQAMAFHMAWTLNTALDMGGGAEKIMRKHNLLRYGALILLFGVILITKTINPLFVFLGVMGLKVGAYIQPFTHKLVTKINILMTRR